MLDINLGGMSGVELQHRLKSSGSNLPIIFMTALEDDALELEARQAGCIAYLQKSFPANSMINAISSAVISNAK